MRSLRLLAAVSLLAAPVHRLAGQEAPPPFHRGQWGAIVSLGFGFSGLGAIRFRSPTRAWVLDASGSTTRNTYAYTDTLTRTFTEDDQSLRLRLGSRAIRAIGTRAIRQITIGITGSVQHQAANQTSRPVTWAYTGGVYFELGGEWLVSDHLGLGAAWTATASGVYRRQTSSGSFPTTNTTKGLSLDFGSAGVRGAFYF